MTDDDLRQRFSELRAEEMRRVPPFTVPRPQPRARWKLQLAAAALFVLIMMIGLVLRPRRQTTFSPADHATARSIAAWHAPTDALLKTPGSEILSSMPAIPDLDLPTEGVTP